MAESDAEKTQQATPRRREEARKQGNVWQPRELAPAAALVVATLMTMLAGPLLWQGLAGFLRLALEEATPLPDDSLPVMEIAGELPWGAPAGLALAVAIVTAGLSMATARNISLNGLAPKLSRISPIAGLQRIFSLTGLAGAGTAILKLAAVAGVASAVLVPLLPRLANIGEGPAALGLLGEAMARLLGAAALVLVVIAVLDAGNLVVAARTQADDDA